LKEKLLCCCWSNEKTMELAIIVERGWWLLLVGIGEG